MKRRSKPGAKARKASRPKARAKKAGSGARHAKKAKPGNAARRSARASSSRKAAPKKPRSRSPKIRLQPGQSMVSEPLEQVSITCANCGRQFTVVKLPGLSLEGMICQRCELGEIESPEN